MSQKILLNNRKGQVQYLLENAFRIGFLMIALLAFILLINYYIINKVDSSPLQADTLANRIMYSDSISYQDATSSKVYVGVIDVKKFSSDINKSIDYGEYKRHVAAKVKLLNKDTNVSTQFITETYLNREQYNYWHAMIEEGATGKGAATMYIKKYPVTVIDQTNQFGRGQKYYGTIVLEIIVPNS